MIVKVQFGNEETHCRIIECKDIHIQQEQGYTELIAHSGEEVSIILHLGKETEDHLYLMDKGQTVDHMVFSPEAKTGKQHLNLK